MDPTISPKMETKMAHGSDIGAVFEDFMTAFDAFKQANDDRLSQLETRMSADIVTEEKVDRINDAMDAQKRQLDQLILKAQRPSLGSGSPSKLDASEQKAAFEAYLRSGDEQSLRALESKAMSVGSDADGGYLVPDELASDIGRRLTALSPIRSIATVRQVSGSVFKKPFAETGPAVGWVGETDARSETAAPTLAELSFPTMELYAMPAATSSLLEDAAVDLETWIAEEVETAFAEQEGHAFVIGDGDKKPTGFLSVATIGRERLGMGSARLSRHRCQWRFCLNRKRRCTRRYDLCIESRIPPKRQFCHEPQIPGGAAQVEGR